MYGETYGDLYQEGLEEYLESLSDHSTTEETEHKRDGLQPCIFCGFKSAVLITGDDCYVRCLNCHAQGPARASEEEAITAWNGALALLWRLERWAEKSDV